MRARPFRFAYEPVDWQGPLPSSVTILPGGCSGQMEDSARSSDQLRRANAEDSPCRDHRIAVRREANQRLEIDAVEAVPLSTSSSWETSG
jgi:hypothetical protein